MTDDKILKGVAKGLGQLGMETIEKAAQEGQKIVESVITGRELLGLDNTMTNTEIELHKNQDKLKSQEEIKRLKGQMNGEKENENNNDKKIQEKPRNIEEELAQLRRQKEREEEEKQKYYEQQKQEQEKEKQRQQAEYVDLTAESTNPSKQKKSRGSAFINKKQHKPDMTEMSATAEFKGNKVQ